MPDLNELETGDCAFCDRERTRPTFLYEGSNFYVIADHAPIAEAHLLLIPHEHYPYLAALPPQLDDEFESLKALLGRFVQENYGALTFWENGVFGQSVPHAHLHAFSIAFDPVIYRDEGLAFSGIAGLRECHAASGEERYFTIERESEARLLPPDWDLYLRIIQFARDSRPVNWRYPRHERRERSGPMIEALMQRWREEVASRLD